MEPTPEEILGIIPPGTVPWSPEADAAALASRRAKSNGVVERKPPKPKKSDKGAKITLPIKTKKLRKLPVLQKDATTQTVYTFTGASKPKQDTKQ